MRTANSYIRVIKPVELDHSVVIKPHSNHSVPIQAEDSEMRTANSYLRVALAQVCTSLSIPLFKSMDTILNQSNDFQSRKRVVARCIKAWGAKSIDQAQTLIKQELSRSDLVTADRFILLIGMIDTAEAYEKGERCHSDQAG